VRRGSPIPSSRGADASNEAELTARVCRAEEDVESLCAEILDRYEEATLVYRVGRQLAVAEAIPPIGSAFLDAAAQSMGARVGELWIREGERTVRAEASPLHAGRAVELREQGPLSALAEGRPWVREATEGSEAIAAVPLPGPGDASAGVMVLRGRADGSSYRAAEIKNLSTIAVLAAAFIRVEREGRAGLVAASDSRDAEVTAEVHRRLHPEDAPTVPGFDVAAGCRPAKGVAGAAYGFLPLRGGQACLYMTDLSRRGVAGALELMTTRGALLAAASRATSAAEVLRGAGAALAGEYARQEVCATAVAVRLAGGGREIGWSSAGHSPQLLVRADRSVEALEASGPALGALGALDYVERVVSLAPGDFVLLATDAVVEACNGRGRAFGAERLREAATGCAAAGARVIRNAVLAEVYRHCGDNVPQEDLTLIVVRATDASPREGDA
jgi:hypothetical protein